MAALGYSSVSEPETEGIAALLLRATELHPKSGVIAVSGEQKDNAELLTYPELLQEARHILGGLQARAGLPGARIVLLLERPRDFIPAFWACLLGGYIPCPLAPIRNDPERWAKHLAHVDVLLGRPLFVSEGSLLDELPATVASASLRGLRKQPHQDQFHHAKLADPAILMLTSGSTGNSKAVELTHGNLLSSMRGRAERQRLTSSDVTFNWIAFDHVAALLESHMIATYVGATQLHTEPALILTNPLQFLSLIHHHRVSLAFAPNFLLGQVNAALQSTGLKEIEERTPKLDLTHLRRIVTGGEANVVETGRRFLELLAPYGLARNALWPAFGMTETCAASVYSHEFPDRDTDREFASVGLPIKGLEIRLVDDHGVSMPEGETGELQLRGPMIFRRYYNNEEATAAAFTPDGWFRTGDLGCLEGGRLSLVARSKDSIIVNGVNYFSHELETKLEQLEGVERSFVAAFPTRPRAADTEQLVVSFATPLDANDEDGLYKLVVAIRNTTIMLWGFRPTLIVPLPKSAFPKSSLGKIQRSLMRKRLEAGDFKAELAHVAAVTERQSGPYTAPETSLERAITNVFSQVLRIDPAALSTSASFFDLGGTSLDILKLARALQRQVGLNTSLPIVLQNPTVRSLAARVASGNKQESREYDPIIPLQVTGSREPLFCVHPGNGEVFVLVNVAKYFVNDRPFYALRPRGFNEGEKRFETIEEIVRTYVDAIVRRQPQGRYAIAGYSLGCPIAFEVAKELEARGKDVAFLGCIDFWPCYDPKPLDFNMAGGLALVLDLIDVGKFEQLNRQFGAARPTKDVCEHIFSVGSPERVAELDIDFQKFFTWSQVAFSVEDLLSRHRTTGKVKSITAFCSEGYSPRYATAAELVPRETWRREIKRWDEHALQSRYVDVAGDHHRLMGPKHVATFQALLRSEIDLAMRSP